MNDIKVEIVKLKRTRMASSYAYGTQPEEEAWAKLEKWARPLGILDDLESRLLFGYSNPCPEKSGDKYAYEFWIEVDDTAEPVNDIRIGYFPGGNYARTVCKINNNLEIIHPTWEKLFEWCQQNRYQAGHRFGLERYLSYPNPQEMTLELMHAIEIL